MTLILFLKTFQGSHYQNSQFTTVLLRTTETWTGYLVGMAIQYQKKMVHCQLRTG